MRSPRPSRPPTLSPPPRRGARSPLPTSRSRAKPSTTFLGIGLGTAYAVAAEFRPSVTTGYGTAFGVGTATLLDEAAVPAVGLGDAPWKADLPTQLYSYASHLVFGGVTEFVRRQVAGTLSR